MIVEYKLKTFEIALFSLLIYRRAKVEVIFDASRGSLKLKSNSRNNQTNDPCSLTYDVIVNIKVEKEKRRNQRILDT